MKRNSPTSETVTVTAPTLKTDTPGVGLSSLVLTPDNYISVEADKVFMSFHQWQGWNECAARQKAKLAGKFTEEQSDAFLLGSYVDKKLLTPENFDAWQEANKELIFNKQGKPRAFVEQAEAMIKTIQTDPVAMKMLAGDHQWIITGEIAGIPWRGMLDVIKPQAEIFVDLKTCRNVNETMWDSDVGMRVFWWETYNYWTQISIYRELIKQKWGKEFLPMLLAIDKQDPYPDKIALSFEDKYRLDQEIKQIEEKTPEVMAWKTGKAELRRCEKCAYCRSTKKLKIITAANQGIRKPAYLDW